MGNCVQSGGGRTGRRDEEVVEDASVLKVKMVLTKGELEWLVAQLKAGDRRLEDVLQDMARKRDSRAGAGTGGDGWRPSLESIVECPETGAVSFD